MRCALVMDAFGFENCDVMRWQGFTPAHKYTQLQIQYTHKCQGNALLTERKALKDT